MRVYVDFESRSQVDIWEAGAYRYAEDPSTEILCLAWAVDNGPVKGALFGPQLKTAILELNDLVRQGAEFHAHNAFFERSIWKHKLTPLYGALPIPLTQWRCTAAKAAASALPRRLEYAAKALECSFQKDLEGSKLMKVLCRTTGPITYAQLDRLLLYCKRDVETERDIDTHVPDLCPSEQRVWFMDQYLNDTGVCVDIDAVQKAIKMIDQETKNLNQELFELTGGLVNAGTKRDAIKRYFESKGVVLTDLTKKTVKDALLQTSGENFRILQLRQQLSLTSNAKYHSLAQAVSQDQRVRDTLVYHGASTGRWSGKLVQIQNLVKATISPEEIERAIGLLKKAPDAFPLFYDVLPTLSSCIRGMFIPSPGYEMFITDFAAIEARVVMWLANETSGLKLFHEQDANPELPDIYVHMARHIHNKDTPPKPTRRKDNWESKQF